MAGSGSAWNAMAQYSFLRIFANDGRLDTAELAMLERLATADGEVDAREKAVLSRILARAEMADLDAGTREELTRFRARYGID